MFQQLLKYFTKRFAEKMGRSPQTASEFMSIQNDVVRYLNKTKGDPKKLTPQSMINERYRAANPFLGFKPTVIQGGKPKLSMEGIEKINKQLTKALDEKKAMFPGSNIEATKKRIFKIDDELEKLSAGEGKYAKMNRKDRENLMIKLQDESSDLQKVPGIAEDRFKDEFRTFQLNVAKNNPEFNQNLAKQVINREMFKDATTEQRKQVLDALESAIRNPKDIEPFASGGLAKILGV